MLQTQIGPSSASVQVTVQVFNFGDSDLKLLSGLTVNLDSQNATSSSPLIIEAGSSVQVTFPNMTIAKSRWWWPYRMGIPTLLQLTVQKSDQTEVLLQAKVGVRQIESGLDEDGYRFYSVNGQRFVVRGGGWANELFLQNQFNWTWTGLHLARHMGLNMIRLEG